MKKPLIISIKSAAQEKQEKEQAKSKPTWAQRRHARWLKSPRLVSGN